MALVLASNPNPVSGHVYDDRVGVRYEYPTRYRRLIREGDPFVYYRSRDGAVNPHYFGSGVIGEIGPSTSDPTRLSCRILDYEAFVPTVPFKAGDDYLESRANGYRGHFEPGVRPISDEDFERIIRIAGSTALATATSSQLAGRPRYASAEDRKLVEDYSVGVASAELGAIYPDCTVEVLPHNEPGHDIEVRRDGQVLRYVEVKGTRSSVPAFFLSEGERAFSARYSDLYTFVIVWEIDLARKTHRVSMQDGEIDPVSFSLEATDWQGVLPSVDYR